MVDLIFDPDGLDELLVARCRISDGPRRTDPAFDPREGDPVMVDDGSGHPLRAIVLRRSGDEVEVRVLEPHPVVVEALRRAM